MPDEYIIREVSLDYIPEIVELYNKFRLWNPPSKFAEGVENLPAFAAFNKNEKMVGFVALALFAPDIVEIYNIHVTDGHRSKGLGSEFVKRLEKVLRESRYRGIISVNSDGYKAYGEKRDATPFYERNEFSLIVKTQDTRVFFKDIKTDD